MITTWNTKGGELYTATMDGLVIIVSGRKDFDDACWNEYLGICREQGARRNLRAVYNFSPIIGPSAMQRRAFSASLGDLLTDFKRTALLSDSALVRGALTATTWVTSNKGMQLRAFSPEKSQKAFEWLAEIYPFDLAEATNVFLDLVKRQGDDPMGMLR